MIKRRLYAELNQLLSQFPAVALIGPRQVGKTTMALALSDENKVIYLDLESTVDQAKLTEPALYLSQHQDKLVILDEVHRLPEIFRELRGIIDRGRQTGKKNGSFLLLGSASIDLLRQSGETLAGRIAYLELSPLDITEMKKSALESLWLRGGFPDSYLAKTDAQSLQWREQFIRTYLERDIPQFGPRIPAETLRRFWIMLAYEQSSLLNASKLGRNLGVDAKTIASYVDLLVDLLLVKRLLPWTKNTGKRMVKSPKIYIRDTGIAHALLGISTMENLLSHPVVGVSWEAFIIENIASVFTKKNAMYFYRSSGGAEIDLVLEFDHQTIWAIEIKRSLSPKVEKGFYYASEDIKAIRHFIVYPGTERYPVSDTVQAIGLRDLINEILKMN